MLVIRKKTMGLIILVLLFLGGFWGAYNYQRFHIKIGEHRIRINPGAKIDPQKKYFLRLWEYDWPGEYGKEYQQYLSEAIQSFNENYPNIQVEVTYLDLMEGPAMLTAALKANDAPDVYCSAFGIPPFDFKRQIPVGPFLSQEEIETYHPVLRKKVTVDRYLGYFPRWIGLNLWIANRNILERAGGQVSLIRESGWSWENLLEATPALGAEESLLVGIPGSFDLNNLSGGDRTLLLERLGQLRETQKIPPDFKTNMLGWFFSGRAMVLADVRPALLCFIRDHLQKKDVNWQIALLPPPRVVSKEIIPAGQGVIAIYRNRRATGDDQIAAAIKLGRFLSVHQSDFFWKTMMLFPAYSNNEVNEEDYQFLDRLLKRSVLVDSKIDWGRTEALRVVEEFLLGKISKEEAVELWNNLPE